MKISIGDKEYEATMGAGTLVAYEEEFGRDLIQDLFGKVTVDDAGDNGSGKDDDGSAGVLFTIDYTQTQWTALLRVAWTAIRTADPSSVPGFREWTASLGELNLNALSEQLVPVAIRQFFRPQGN